MLVRIMLAVAMIVSVTGQARGDDRPGASVAGNVSALNMASSTDLSFAGSFTYMFNRVVGIEVEATFVPELRSGAFDDRAVIQGGALEFQSGNASRAVSPLIFPSPTFSNPEGRLIVFTNNIRVDIPTTMRRIAPFFVAGGGVAHTRERVDYSYPIFPLNFSSLTGVTPALLTPQTLLARETIRQRITSSATELALTLGGGVGFGLTSHVSIDADLRLFRLLGDTDRNAGRFGVAARYRF